MPRLQRPEPVVHPHELGAAAGGAGDGLERVIADDVHEDLDVLGVLAVGVPGESEIAARAHADAELAGAAIGVGGLLDLVAEPAGRDHRLADAEAGPVLDDGVEVPEPRHEGEPLVRDHAERLVVGVGGVLERVHARLGGHPARLLPAHVRRGHAAAHARLVHQRRHLGQGIGAVADGGMGQERVAADIALHHVGAVLMERRTAARICSGPSAMSARPSMPSLRYVGFQSAIPPVAQMSRLAARSRGPG